MPLDAAPQKTFRWDDPLDLSSRLSEEERMIWDAARQYAREKLLPRVVSAFAEERFDREIMTEMGELGFLGPTLPEEYGCAGVNHVAYGLIAREIEAIDSGYRSAMSVQSSLVMYPIYAFGSEEQRRKYLPGMAAGRDHRLLRPDRARRRLRPGLDAHRRQEGRRRLRPERRQDVDHQLAGQRRRPGLGQAGRQDPRLPGRARHRRASRPRRSRASSRLRASVTGEISLSDVFVPEDAMLPGVEGLRGPFSCLNKARYGIAWGAMGAAEFCLHASRDYVSSRSLFGRTLASRQLVQKKLADMQTEIALGFEGALALGRLIDEGAWVPEAISLMKRNNCGKALDIARVARDMHGGNGISGEYHVMRHAANLETVNTYEGAHDVHALILGRAITGESAF